MKMCKCANTNTAMRRQSEIERIISIFTYIYPLLGFHLHIFILAHLHIGFRTTCVDLSRNDF